MRGAACLALLAALVSSGCPEPATNGAEPANAPCTQLGQRCEFSPGKLGSCVIVDNCRGSNCFVCQSQH